MPELPEVENYRQILLPLISDTHPLKLKRLSIDKKPPRKFLSDDDIASVHDTKYYVQDVLRKGKQLALQLTTRDQKSSRAFLLLHMGMTGRISSATHVPRLMELSGTAAMQYPPPHSYLQLETSTSACFSDPRKFGSVVLQDTTDFAELAPDAHDDLDANRTSIRDALMQKSRGIKAILMDQKRVVSGVGNWIADEVMYQSRMHPDQTHLTMEQADLVVEKLGWILTTAVGSLKARKEFPSDWMFHARWTKKKEGSKTADGKKITFVTSGGRTSAIVTSLQKLKSQKKSAGEAKKTKMKEKPKTEGASQAVPDGVKEDSENDGGDSEVSDIQEGKVVEEAGKNIVVVEEAVREGKGGGDGDADGDADCGNPKTTPKDDTKAKPKREAKPTEAKKEQPNLRRSKRLRRG